MNIQELYLKTVFACMTCDGDIADEEVDVIRRLTSRNDLFAGLDVESLLNRWITEINKSGATFLKDYLDELSAQDLTTEQQLQIVDLAIETIEADQRIEYSEVSFFKKLRLRLPIDDEAIVGRHPDKEEWLWPDIVVKSAPEWDNVKFADISLDLFPQR